MKGPPKPGPVKPTTDCPPFLFDGTCRASGVYIFVTSPILANIANAPPIAGCRRHPPSRFVSSPSAALTTPLRAAFLASPGCHRFHLNLDEPQRLAHTPPSNRPDADDDANDDVQYRLRPSRARSPPCSACKSLERPHCHPHDYSTISAPTRAVEPLSA